MNTIVFEAVKAVVMITVAVACLYVIPVARKYAGTLNLNTMEIWAENAVRYAEQWMKTQSGDGEEKKTVVMDILRRIRDSKGIKITDEQLDILIESAVNAMNEVNIQYMIAGDTDE